jgi:hypothetical protein
MQGTGRQFEITIPLDSDRSRIEIAKFAYTQK